MLQENDSNFPKENANVDFDLQQQEAHLDSDLSHEIHLDSDWSKETYQDSGWSQEPHLDADWPYANQILETDWSSHDIIDLDVKTIESETNKDLIKQNGGMDSKWISEMLEHHFFYHGYNFNLTSWPFVNPVDGSYSISISL